MNEDFYIGWEEPVPAGTRRRMRAVGLGLLFCAVLAAVVLAVSQRMIGQSVFEWGSSRTFSGILQTQPYPHLLVPRPGNAGGTPQFSTYHLVATWKFGLNREAIAPMAGQSVTLRGKLIYRGSQTMVETKEEWIQRGDSARTYALPLSTPIGRRTVVGEIVDSKCFLGVMNPGQLAPHRACAIRCISGGVPPLLLVRPGNGPATYFWLVSADGQPVNQQVLGLVAEPVEISGEVVRQGASLILRADPSTYRKAL